MKITLPYRECPEIEVPDRNLLGIFGLPSEEGSADADRVVRSALQAPIGSARLVELARGKSRVLIVCDDIARPTPASKIIPFVLAELHEGGVRDDGIECLMALGTHRAMTPDEMRRKVGADIYARYPVHNHAWDDPSALVSVGKTLNGVDVLMNRKVVDADLVVGIGRVMPIDVCGFTGGGKILIPGCCGETTLDEMHWHRVDLSDDDVIGKRDNVVRATIDTMARQAGLGFIVNVVLDSQSNIVDCVAGDLVEAHREGCRRARARTEVHIPIAPDVVVVDGAPFDIEFWQVNKALDTAGLVVRQGGVVICISPCYEGLSRSHADILLRYGYRSRAEIRELVEQGKIRPKVVGVHMTQVAHVAREKAHVILVTSGISREDVERVGLGYALSPNEALEEAFRRIGPHASVVVLRNAAEMLPVVGPRS